ncbi:MAG: hypothetical protein LBG62_04035 [Candidatus Methanoplasma sp.]|jgi:ATP-dependent DNA helicase RecG|nr:hypothetical protein [Candidatus Methanoplasma sp.]
MGSIDLRAILQELRAHGENEVFEAKDRVSFSDNRMGEYFSALSNEASLRDLDSAWMVFGLSDGDLESVDSRYKDGCGDLDRLSMFIAEFCDGMSYASVREHFEEGKRMVFFQIPPARPGVPTRFKRIAYERQGSSTVPMSVEKMKLIFEQTRPGWMDMPAEGVTVGDLDNYAFKMFKDRGRKFDRISETEMGFSPEAMFGNLGLTRGGRPTRSAAILFGMSPKSVSAAAMMRIGRIAGASTMLFYDELEGPMYELIDRAVRLILSKYTVTYVDFQGIVRVEHYPYPQDALREALLNAVINTDYERGRAIRVDVCDDSIRIYNSGDMPNGMSPEEVAAKHYSKPRNEGMANVFFKSYYVEKFGTGMEKMRGDYARVGVDPPVYEVVGDTVVVTLKDIVRAKGVAQSGAAGIPPVVMTRDGGFTERHLAALRLMGERGEVAIDEVGDLFGIGREGARKSVVRPMIESGMIEMTSSAKSKNQRYRLTEKGRRMLET